MRTETEQITVAVLFLFTGTVMLLLPSEVMIWVGIVTIVAVGVGLLTPPFGIAAFLAGAALSDRVSLGDV